MQDKKKDFTTICLPKQLVEELKIWRKAFMVCYPLLDISYEMMIRRMLETLNLHEPEVSAEFNRMCNAAWPEGNGDVNLKTDSGDGR